MQSTNLRGTALRGTLLRFFTRKLETPQPTLLTLMLRPHGQNKRKSGYGFWPQVLSSSYSLSLSFCSCMIYPDYSCADHNCYPTPSFPSLPTTLFRRDYSCPFQQVWSIHRHFGHSIVMSGSKRPEL